jgi:glutamyl-tRNA synthetase
MKDTVLKWVLKNISEFGKVNPKFVLGMILKEKEEFRKKVPEVIKEIEKVAAEVEKLSKDEIKKNLEKISPGLFKGEGRREKESGRKKRGKKGLKELSGGKKGKVVMRFAPSPSGALHIGHAHALLLNSEYCKKYKGKLILRIEDTNPENIYDEAYQLIEDNANWLTGNNVKEVVIQSDRLKHYYNAAEELVKKGKAYVCTCDSDIFRKLIVKGKSCSCRGLGVKKQVLRYKKMFNVYKPGEAVLRLKTNLKDKNPAMRDFPLIRVNESEHPRKGTEFRVWPLMNLAVAVDDHLLGVTHTIRGKDHRDNEKRQDFIFDYLGWNKLTHLYIGRTNFKDLKLSSSETRKLIDGGKYSGWDDIRLPFLPALKRRGYQPKAFVKYSLEMGLTENDKHVSKEEFFKALNAFNKEIIEPKANRYFFVDNPKLVVINGVKIKNVELNLHPDFPKKGLRKFKLNKKFYLAESDFKLLREGKLHRLMDAFNFEILKKKFKFVSNDYKDYKNSKNKGIIIHWLPVDGGVKVEVIMEDKSVVKGIGENGMVKLEEGNIVQLERRYFAILDSKKKDKLVFWYLHK